MERPRASHLLLLAIATAAVLAPGLSTMPLVETTEGRYASIAKAMVESGDWIVPHYNGLPHLEKPPLAYWLAAASMKAFGETEFAARLPVLLAAVGLVLVTAWLGAAMFDRRTGIVAAVMLMSCVEFAGIERILATDPFLAFSVAVAIAAFWEGFVAETEGRVGRSAFFVMQVAMAVGVLAKGPLGLLWPLIAILPVLIASRRLGVLRRMRWLPGIALIAGTTGLWLFVLERALPGGAEYLLLDRATAAARSAKGFHPGPWWFYLAAFPGGFFPWVLLLPEVVAGCRGTAASDPLARAKRLLLACWVLVPIVLFSVFPAKLPSYVFPMYLAASVLGAWGIGGQGKGGMRIAVAVLVLLALVGAAALGWPATKMKHLAFLADHRWSVALPALVGAAVALGTAVFARRTGRVVGAAAAMVVFSGGLASGIGGVASDLFSSKSLALKLREVARPADCLVFYQCEPSGVEFYTGLRGININFVKLKTPARIADVIIDAPYWNREDRGALLELLKGRRRVLGLAPRKKFVGAVRGHVPIHELASTSHLVLFEGNAPADEEGREGSGWHRPQ